MENNNDVNEHIQRDLKEITENLIRLSVKLDVFLERLNKLDNVLIRDYVRKESLQHCTRDLQRIENAITWISRAVIGALIGLMVTMLQVNVFK